MILTVLKYFTYTKYRLKDALVKEICQSKTVEKLEKTAEARTNNKTTTITFNNSQRTKETPGLYIYIQEANKLNKMRYKLTTNTTEDRKWHKNPGKGTENAKKNKKELICEESNHTYKHK